MNIKEIEGRILAAFVRDKSHLAYAQTLGIKAGFFETENAQIVYRILNEVCPEPNTKNKNFNFFGIKLKIKTEATSAEPTIVESDIPRLFEYVDEISKYEDDDSFEFTIEWFINYAKERLLSQDIDKMKYLLMTQGKEAAINHFVNDCMHTQDLECWWEPEDLERGFSKRWDQREKELIAGTAQPIPLGLPTLDARLEGGIRPQEILIILGLPGVGKSLFVDSTGVLQFKAGYDVLKITTENRMSQSIGRTESIYYNLNYRQLQNCDPTLPKHTIESSKPRANRHYTIRLFPEENTVADVIRVVELLKLKFLFDPQVIIIDSPDFLKLIREKYNDHRTYAISNMYLKLKKFIEQTNKALICTSHVQLQARREKIDFHHGSDSAAKARVADLILTLNQTQEMEDVGEMELYGAKLRDVASGKFSILLKRKLDSPGFEEKAVSEDV